MMALSPDHVVQVFVDETGERLDEIERVLLLLEESSDECDPELINSIFRDAHSIKAGANLLKFNNIESLSHSLENLLDLFRKGEAAPDSQAITAMLAAVDKLYDLIGRASESNDVSIRLQMTMLVIARKRLTRENGTS